MHEGLPPDCTYRISDNEKLKQVVDGLLEPINSALASDVSKGRSQAMSIPRFTMQVGHSALHDDSKSLQQCFLAYRAGLLPALAELAPSFVLVPVKSNNILRQTLAAGFPEPGGTRAVLTNSKQKGSVGAMEPSMSVVLDHRDYKAFSKRITKSKRMVLLCLVLPEKGTTPELYCSSINELVTGNGNFGVVSPEQILPVYVIEC